MWPRLRTARNAVLKPMATKKENTNKPRGERWCRTYAREVVFLRRTDATEAARKITEYFESSGTTAFFFIFFTLFV